MKMMKICAFNLVTSMTLSQRHQNTLNSVSRRMLVLVVQGAENVKMDDFTTTCNTKIRDDKREGWGEYLNSVLHTIDTA
jgi:hypothetical protein